MMQNPVLPQSINDHVFNEKIAAKFKDLYANLSVAEVTPLNKLIWQKYYKQLSIVDFSKQAEKLNLPNFKEKIWPQILRYDFLPIADAIGIDLGEWANKLPSELQKTLLGKIITTEKWVSDYILSQNLEVSVEGRRRLVFLAGEYLRGEKNIEQIKEQLTRPFKVGGLELLMEVAERFSNDLVSRCAEATENDEIFTSQKIGEIIIKEQTEIKPSPSNVPVVASVVNPARPVAPPVIPKTNTTQKFKDDVTEMQKTLAPSLVPLATNNFEAQADSIIRQSGVSIPPDLLQRLKTLIISRLREVRKAGEVKERLLAHTLNGGMGLSAEVADKILLLIEATKKNEIIATPKENVAPKKEEIVLKEFPSLPTISASAVETPSSQPPAASLVPEKKPIPLPKPVPASVVNQPKPISIPPTNLPFKTTPSSSDIRPSAPVLKITEEKSKPKMQEVSMPVVAKPPVTSAIPQTPSGRAKMDDVAFRPHLMGPVEELQQMNLVEFRRLSPKPRVAADKILTKVELLAKEGYDKKLKGIEAWQKSVLNQLYNALLSESLNKGKPVTQIISEKLSAQQETLSEEEFKVIMDLSRVLRF
ncbi:MAG: hypothetical protein NTU97_01630 [Candidatus Magasanikbacteria bacterium]|nr:hypothetical protein [Candidatus Magasanikbacteria bacterium]